VFTEKLFSLTVRRREVMLRFPIERESKSKEWRCVEACAISHTPHYPNLPIVVYISYYILCNGQCMWTERFGAVTVVRLNACRKHNACAQTKSLSDANCNAILVVRKFVIQKLTFAFFTDRFPDGETAVWGAGVPCVADPLRRPRLPTASTRPQSRTEGRVRVSTGAGPPQTAPPG